MEDPATKAMLVKIPARTHEDLAMMARMFKTTMQDFILEAILKHMSENKKRFVLQLKKLATETPHARI